MRCGSRRPTRVRHRVPGVVARDAATERDRLRVALDAAAAELTALAAEAAGRAGEDVGAIFEAQALFASDPGIVDPALAAIDDGATAEEAIDRVSAAQADALAAVDDEYFRERAADLRDVGRRVVDRLTGRERPPLHRADGSPAVLVADDLDPSVVVAIRPEMVTGIALAGGAPTGHAAIVARALGIPLVLGLGAAVGARLDGAEVAVDGSGGRLLVEPDKDDLEAMTSVASAGSVAGGWAGSACRGRGERRVRARGGGRGGCCCGRHRPRPDGAAVPRPVRAARPRRAALGLPPDRGGAAGPPRRLPDARHRRRQARALSRDGARDEPGARGSRHPRQPRPSGPVRDAAAGAPRGDARRTGLDPPADGRDGRRGGRGPRGARPRRRCVGAGGHPDSERWSDSG